MYARENYRKVKDIIENRRRSAIAESEARNMEVASISEDIRLIDKEMRGTGLALFKTACAGGDISEIRERNIALGRRRREALIKLGLPEDYTDIHYTCPECSDSGFVDTKMCKCFREMLITENIKSSGMGKLIEKQSFQNFNLERYKDDETVYKNMKKNLKEAKQFANTFETLGTTLLFSGFTGTGKTHLSTAIAKQAIERGFEVLYDSAQNIISAFENDKFKSGYGPYEPKGDKYLECDLLILDDLGAEFSSQFGNSCLYNLLNTRQNKSLATIISTNLSPSDLANRYEGRIYSRLIGNNTNLRSFSGNDMRLIKKETET